MSEAEVVVEGEVVEETPGEDTPDSPGSEMVVAGDAVPAPTTLFRTDDPAEIVKRATEVANSLSEVLRTQKGPDGKLRMISNISGREHVKIEGWTFCGTMLGVFAVPVWTRKLENPEGWEARAEARTLDGHIVGSAEAQCTRDEEQWGWHPKGRNGRDLTPRDDFALRSMAQTRAASKALRLPLGFIMEIAGFASTPAEEMVAESESAQPQPQERRQEGPPAFPVPKSWPDIEQAVKGLDNGDESWGIFQAYLRAASYHLFGAVEPTAATKEQKMVLLQKAAGAAVWIRTNDEHTFQAPEFYFGTVENMALAWKAVMDGADLPIPDYVPPEPPEAEELEKMAREEGEYQ